MKSTSATGSNQTSAGCRHPSVVRRGQLLREATVLLVQVRATDTPGVIADRPPPPGNGIAGMIEIALPDASHVRVGDDVSLKALRWVVAALRR